MAGAGELSDLARSVVERAGADLPGGPIAVALSGGADSAVCAWALLAAGAEVRAIVIDHGLPASPDLVEAARAIARDLGIEATVIAAATARGEAAMRDARYTALESAAADRELVALGHTADDHLETVIAHLLRGAGAAGLSGIPARRGRWIRPLLEVHRTETRSLAAGLGLPFRDDPDNTDRALTRVRIRDDVVPVLEAIAPSVREVVSRAARLAAEDDRALEQRAANVPVQIVGGDVVLPRGSLRALPPAVASRVVRQALRMLLDPYPGSSRDVDTVLAVASGAAERLPLTGGLVVAREGPEVVIHGAGEPPAPPPPSVFESGRSIWGPWTLTVASAAPGPAPIGRWRVLVNPDAVSGARVRCAIPGDRIDLVGGTKAVFEALREAGIPGRRRLRWPVVEVGGRMVWIPGARVADWARAQPDGSAVLLSAETGT